MFDDDEVRLVNVLSDGTYLAVDATYSDDSTGSYSIDSFGFAYALGLMERQRDNAIALEDAGKCEYDEFDGCFLTTATCGAFGLPEDCFELRALRRFRDRYMTRKPPGRAGIADYCAKAPAPAR